MSEMLGADVEELRALARDFAGSSQKLAQAQRTLDGAVNQLPRYWQGPDAQRFASQWRGQHRGVISRTASMLDDAADLLKKNATEQEQTSAVAGLGGPSGGDNPGTEKKPEFQFGPDWLADEDSPFRNGWNAYEWAKLIPNMRAGIFDMASMLSKANRAGFFDPAAWIAFQKSNAFSQFANMSSDLFDGNWGSAFMSETVGEVFKSAKDAKVFKLLEGGGHALGVLGVGLDVMDGVNHLADGEYGEAGYSAAKALLGAISFAPPPVGTAAAIASGALFLYDNVPIIHDSVNYVGDKIAEGTGKVVDAVADTGKKVAKFFGF